mmetsp:Transcript_19298/g.46001  ORF Transcript_19298/g.46001 Transcript_19298/m.46001 type:complete len:139 (+) Transcript_19298:1-417(+)
MRESSAADLRRFGHRVEGLSRGRPPGESLPSSLSGKTKSGQEAAAARSGHAEGAASRTPEREGCTGGVGANVEAEQIGGLKVGVWKRDGVRDQDSSGGWSGGILGVRGDVRKRAVGPPLSMAAWRAEAGAAGRGGKGG